MDEGIKWLLTLASASFAAYLGSLFALKRSKNEKLWIQKQGAYLNIIESLHNIIIWSDEEYALHFPMPLPSVSKKKLDELRINQRVAIDSLRKHVHLGGLIVSLDASKQLDELLSEYYSAEFAIFDEPHYEGPSDDISKLYSKIREIAEKNIEKVKTLAKKDLNL